MGLSSDKLVKLKEYEEQHKEGFGEKREKELGKRQIDFKASERRLESQKENLDELHDKIVKTSQRASESLREAQKF